VSGEVEHSWSERGDENRWWWRFDLDATACAYLLALYVRCLAGEKWSQRPQVLLGACVRTCVGVAVEVFDADLMRRSDAERQSSVACGLRRKSLHRKDERVSSVDRDDGDAELDVGHFGPDDCERSECVGPEDLREPKAGHSVVGGAASGRADVVEVVVVSAAVGMNAHQRRRFVGV
jgi:hypothetical protein